ncbi:hypothetical protein PCASD_13630 [Puccinia coronata f. sp. avenae]|uniref:Uncharacterized protein n=1 Tax=Puccinia coronata f. sp. avenae TaxID=200324 RepID=A0A2N5TDC7_9BASI|nr:hypothetical protein PCASD_13630 [Puccinia coronata f. sp. avenae]
MIQVMYRKNLESALAAGMPTPPAPPQPIRPAHNQSEKISRTKKHHKIIPINPPQKVQQERNRASQGKKSPYPIIQTMEYLNDAAFDNNSESQESWLTPSPGATKYIPFLDSQTQGSPVQGSQVLARSAAASSGAFPLIVPTRNVSNPFQNAPAQPFVTRNAADPKHQAPPPPLATRNACASKQNAHPLPSGAAMPTPGGHTPFSGIPPPPIASTPASLAAAGIPDSQQLRTYTQPGVIRAVHLDYVLYSRSVIGDLMRTTRPSSSISKKEAKKEWEKYTPSGNLRVWEVDLSTYDFEELKNAVVEFLGRDRALFRKLLDTLIRGGDIKWQAIIANSRVYGPKKFAYLTSDQDVYEFVEAVYEALNSKVTIKLVMGDPLGKAKQLEHERSLEENLTLAFGPDDERARLEREKVRLLGNPKADVTANPVAPKVAQLMQHIVAKWGRNDEKYWIGNLNDRTESMQISNDLFPIWGRALLHNQNPAVTLDHPPKTKQFIWIKRHTPMLTELAAQGQAPENTTDNPKDNNKDAEPPRSPSALPDNPLASYLRDPSPLPATRLQDNEEEESPAPPPPSSDIEFLRRKAKHAKALETSYDSPISLEPSQTRSPEGSPSRKYARSPTDARSPTGDLIGDVIRRLSVHRGGTGNRVPSVSPVRKQPASRGSCTPQRARLISATGKAVGWEEFLTHCSFANTDMVPRGLIQVNHIPHWSFFLTMSVPSLMKMRCPFPEATARQLMYGTYSMPAEYFVIN